MNRFVRWSKSLVPIDTPIPDPGAADIMRPLAADEIHKVHENRHYRFFRARKGGEALFVKSASIRPLDTGAIAALRHEYELLHDIGIEGVVKVTGLLQSDNALSLVMEDAGGQNLAARLRDGALAPAAFCDIATRLARAVAGLHGAGIIHRGIGPDNIAWCAATGRATLLDFQTAMLLTTLPVAGGDAARPEGNLAYLSPEQTGRTGRPVDARSDLYSLGATLYEMLTGAPPFTARDPIELVHAHLARRPRAPHAVDAAIPAALSGIVLKLLEKEPERRYLTAAGLAADLARAGGELARTGTVQPFALGEHDVPHGLYLPEKLYGRARERATLRAAFDRACQGRRELALVTGAPGIGKSALVNDLERQVMRERGYFIAGKFDQLQRNVPYAGLVQALRMLVRQLLTEPDDALAAWRQAILAAVGPNGGILVDVIPEIEAILQAQPAVAALEPVESKNRFSQVFTSFLGVFGGNGRPFVLFLDDLQWADAASLQLIGQWIGDAGGGHLLVVGAYRDSEVGLAHPLARLFAEVKAAGAQLPEIHLGPLEPDDVGDLLADAFGQPPGQCARLAGLVAAKTAGNPFFIRRLLHELHKESLVRFDPRAGSWTWNIDEIERAPVSDNVLALMVRAIDRLPEAARELLQAGACIGHDFDLGTLAEVGARSRTTAMNDLWPAIEDGLLVPLREAYKAPRQAGPLDDDLAGLPVVLRFVHDRVQQAAYSLLGEERRQALHLAIARQLLRSTPAGELEARLFDVADQFALGAALVADPAERLRVAELYLGAGRKAKATAAYEAAFDYLAGGRQLLPPSAWRAHAALAFALHRELAEAAYLAGRHAVAEQVIEASLAHAPSKVALADLYSLRVLAATVAGDWSGALRWGREGLAVFGHAWPLDGLAAANDAEAAAVPVNLGARRVEDLVSQPEVADDDIRACMRLLSILGPPAYFSGSAVLTFLVTRGANLSLLHGASPYSAFAYVFHGALHNARTGQYDVGHAFGKVALALARRFGNRAEESRTLEVFGLVVHAWRMPLRDSLPLMIEGHRAGVESGELAYAAFNLCGILINGLPAAVPLPGLLADADLAVEFATRHRNRTGREISLPFRQFARAMTGRTPVPARFDDGDFDESRFLDETQGNQTAIGQFWVARLQATYLFGDYAAALHSAREGAKCVDAGILGMVTSAEHVFYSALALAAQDSRGQDSPVQGLPAQDLTEPRASIAPLRARLANWAVHCPANFLHKQKLVDAELARLDRAPWRAMELYGEAIEAARQHGFVQDAALANELAAAMFLAQGQPRLANVYLDAALAGYRGWGATAKVAALAKRHPGLVAAPPEARPMPAHAAPPLALDALGLIRASQAIAAETVRARLFERILQIVVELAGAQTGMLLLGDTAALRVRARIAAEDGTTIVLEDTALADCPLLPRAIARYVARLQQPVVLGDAAREGAFAADAEVQSLGLRSVLCVPLRQNLQLMGLLYLENRAMAHAFTAARVEVVQALAAQAAISLENSTLLRERERAELSARFLAGAGAALAESLDYAATLARVTALGVPTLADWCILDLVDEYGNARRAGVAHGDPAQHALAAALKAVSIPAAGNLLHPATQALHEGQAVLLTDVSGERVRAMAYGDEHRRLILATYPRSFIAVPLSARGRTLGVLTFIASAPRRPYGQADLALAGALADRCALAMDNAALYREAQDAIRVREDFLAVASHELRTPLTPLQLQIHIIERRLPRLFDNGQGGEDGAAWLAPRLRTLRRQGQRLERLVTELLDISRITSRQLQLELEEVELADIVRQVIERLEDSGEIAQAGSALAVGCDAGIVGSWDRLRIEQVVTNLLSNALKYGEGKPVALRATSDGTEAVIEVTDHGLGIESAHLQRIFGRFERAVSARQYGGLGLGLYIASQIVTALGGNIHVTSTPGAGSTFTVRLPLAQSPSPGKFT
ncbi:AAA family ATPase [Pseudoduganella dura]|nr:AAA family ATPase [Pseudoduganella dura]